MLPRWHSGKEYTHQCRGCRRQGFDPWFWKVLWGRKWQMTPIFSPGKSHGLRSLVGYSPQGCQELETIEQLSMHTSHTDILYNAYHEYTHIYLCVYVYMGFPGGSDSEKQASSAGDLDSVPGLGRSSGEGNGYSPQFSCLQSPKDRGAWLAIVHEVTKSWT